MFWNNLRQFNERVALITEDGTYSTYRSLLDVADAMSFKNYRRTLVLLRIGNDASSLAAYLSALRAGHAIILINADDEASFRNICETFSPQIIWSRSEGLIHRAAAIKLELHENLTLLLSTSGSTGSSKLVRLSSSAVDANAVAIVDYLGIAASDRVITTLPPAYSFGLSIINSHLAAGASLVLSDVSVTDPAFRDAIVQHHVTGFSGVPYTYELLIASGGINALPNSIKSLTQAGGRMTSDKVEYVRQSAERQGVRFFVMYGQTEATARMSYMRPEDLAAHPDCIGGPIPGGAFSFLEPSTGEPAQTSGELAYSGANVMMGYAEAPSDLAKGHEITALATGDLAELVAPGIYRITGRKSRNLKIFGLRVSLDHVEQQVASLGWNGVATGNDDRIIIAVEDHRNPHALAAQIARTLKLPPDRVMAIQFSSLPRMLNSKPDYQAIRSIAEERRLDPCEPDPILAYASFLARLAGKSAVDETACFKEIGGDSLNYVEASMMVERIVGCLPNGWEMLTIGELAQSNPHLEPSASPELHPVHIKAVQTMRAIAILLVVCAHSVRPVGQIVGEKSLFAQSLFFNVSAIFIFVAGFLFQYLLSSFSYQTYLKVKGLTVLLPYLIVSLPAVLIFRLGLGHAVGLGAPGWVDTKVEWFGYMILTGTSLGPLWFVPMMALVYLLSPLLRKIDNRPWLYLALLPLGLASALVGRPVHNNNPLQELVFFLPAYVFGMLVSKYQKETFPVIAKYWPILIVPFVIPAFLDFNLVSFPQVSLASKLISSLGILGLCIKYAKGVPSWFLRLGELSFGIYFVHGYVLLLGGSLSDVHLRAGRGAFAVTFLGMVTAVVAISVVVVLIIKKIFKSHSRELIGA